MKIFRREKYLVKVFYPKVDMEKMEKCPARVSDAQWNMLLDFFELNPNLARKQGHNNSARGRAETSRLWQKVTSLLHADKYGTRKTPKEWSIYVSNYKSKLKKIIADLSADTSGEITRESRLSDNDIRLLTIMGLASEQKPPPVSVDPFPDEDPQPMPMPSTSPDIIAAEAPMQLPTRRRRVRSRPLAPLDEARRTLLQMELQRATADAATASALDRIGQNLGRIADAADRYLSYIIRQQ